MKQAELAAYLDVSVRTLRDLIARGIVPKGADLDAARKGYLRHLREVAANRVPTGALDPAQERAALDAERRRELELKNGEREGRLIDADEVGNTWTNLVLVAKARLLSIPSRVAYDVVRTTDLREAEKLLKGAIHDALRELADSAKAKLDDDDAAQLRGD